MKGSSRWDATIAVNAPDAPSRLSLPFSLRREGHEKKVQGKEDRKYSAAHVAIPLARQHTREEKEKQRKEIEENEAEKTINEKKKEHGTGRFDKRNEMKEETSRLCKEKTERKT